MRPKAAGMRPTAAPTPRTPKFVLGTRVTCYGDFVGYVDVIYADYWAAVDSFAVPPEWWEIQETPCTGSKDQVFYSVYSEPVRKGGTWVGTGSVLCPEADVCG